MSNWNEEMDTLAKCLVCKYHSLISDCVCPDEFMEAQCSLMESRYYDRVDENGKHYHQSVTGREYKSL